LAVRFLLAVAEVEEDKLGEALVSWVW